MYIDIPFERSVKNNMRVRRERERERERENLSYFTLKKFCGSFEHAEK